MKAAGATNVSVDLEGLDCTVCFGPLKPPVFQVIRSNSFFLLSYTRETIARLIVAPARTEMPRAECSAVRIMGMNFEFYGQGSLRLHMNVAAAAGRRCLVAGGGEARPLCEGNRVIS
jgi:hypothetical protein